MIWGYSMSYLLTISVMSIVVAYMFAITDMLKFSISTSLHLKYSLRTIIAVFVAIVLTLCYIIIGVVR